MLGNNFKNQAIDEILESFQIERSLSMKGCPHDNAVAETTYKGIKNEFINSQRFETQEQLVYELSDYVSDNPGGAKHNPPLLGNGDNNHQIYSSLGYLSAVTYRQNTL